MEYELKRYRQSRNVRISVRPGGSVFVSAPKRLPKFIIEAFVAKHSAWIAESVAKMLKREPLKRPNSRSEYLKFKEEVHFKISQRLRELNAHYGFIYNKVSIRNQSSRWGSCSKSGTLSFNYRLIFKPAEVFDYVLVHELCHLKEMNHSVKFWDLVARTCPNYKILRRQLKQSAF